MKRSDFLAGSLLGIIGLSPLVKLAAKVIADDKSIEPAKAVWRHFSKTFMKGDGFEYLFQFEYFSDYEITGDPPINLVMNRRNYIQNIAGDWQYEFEDSSIITCLSDLSLRRIKVPINDFMELDNLYGMKKNLPRR